ncbi:MAG: SDR family oxidoreductase [Proteobacteria bacterium]|nr:SDR family oxidoreductase [Pseudomonadota bacterium]
MNETAIVTGASNGIGWATAERLADQGLVVINLDIAAPKRESRAIHHRVDLSDSEATAAVLSEVTARHSVTRLVNNAGHATAAALEDTTFDDLRKTVEINLRATIQCTQAVLPAMKAAGFGRIVNISSRTALGKALRTAYAATKGGLISMTRGWALELAPHGITVNAVAPGPIATELFDAVNPPGSPRTEKIIQDIPVKRIGRPEDIANAVSFFLSDASGYVTGQTLYVCGGLSVGAAPV